MTNEESMQELTTKNDLEVDCICRTELLKAMDTWDKFGYTTRYGLERLDKDDKGFVPYIHYEDMVNCVKGMPSVTPQEPRWIPVSEKLPEESGSYLCTFGASNTVGDDYFTTKSDAKKIFGDDFGDWAGGWQTQDVLAWMPLPKAYSEDKE